MLWWDTTKSLEMSYASLESQFDFNRYIYQVAFEEVDCSFWEELFSRKETKLIYYIRRVSKHNNYTSEPEEVLHKDMDNYSIGFKFGKRGFLAYYFKVFYYDDISEPQRLLQKLKYRDILTVDNVVLSSEDL